MRKQLQSKNAVDNGLPELAAMFVDDEFGMRAVIEGIDKFLEIAIGELWWCFFAGVGMDPIS